MLVAFVPLEPADGRNEKAFVLGSSTSERTRRKVTPVRDQDEVLARQVEPS